MKTIMITSMLLASSSAVLAQNGTIAQSHRPNEHTLACLEAPTRDCAFSAALQTVIAEEFGVERAKVLTAVSRAMLETDQQSGAIETLMLALDEARSVNLSLVTQEKITEIAPLLARAGDTASALALAQELEIQSVRDRALIAIARESVMQGRLADADVALSQMSNQNRAFWQRLSMLPFASQQSIDALNLAELEAKVRTYDLSSQQYRGLILLAVLADRQNKTEERQAYLLEADELFTGLVSINDRALAVVHRLRAMSDGGMAETFLEESYGLALMHASRVRSAEILETIASVIGTVEVSMGNLEAALLRVETYTDVDGKARYLSTLGSAAPQGAIDAEIRALLSEIADLEGVYERDLLRLQLLEGALDNKDTNLAIHIIKAIEDDDNQARGLALAAPLFPSS